MPSYVNTDMKKVLPKDILAKQGKRVIDNSSENLCQLLKHHQEVAQDCADLEAIAREVELAGNFGALDYLRTQVEIKRAGLKDVNQKIRVRVKGRLVRPMMAEATIYEIFDFDEKQGTVILRRLFDQNGILLRKDNTQAKVRKSIRGVWLEKHYLIMAQEEEYAIRQKLLSNTECKIVVKYQVMDIDGEPTALTQ